MSGCPALGNWSPMSVSLTGEGVEEGLVAPLVGGIVPGRGFLLLRNKTTQQRERRGIRMPVQRPLENRCMKGSNVTKSVSTRCAHPAVSQTSGPRPPRSRRPRREHLARTKVRLLNDSYSSPIQSRAVSVSTVSRTEKFPCSPTASIHCLTNGTTTSSSSSGISSTISSCT